MSRLRQTLEQRLTELVCGRARNGFGIPIDETTGPPRDSARDHSPRWISPTRTHIPQEAAGQQATEEREKRTALEASLAELEGEVTKQAGAAGELRAEVDRLTTQLVCARESCNHRFRVFSRLSFTDFFRTVCVLSTSLPSC